jgi:Flp pilus assembly protein TadD
VIGLPTATPQRTHFVQLDRLLSTAYDASVKRLLLRLLLSLSILISVDQREVVLAETDGHDAGATTNADLKHPGIVPDAAKPRISLASVHELAGLFTNISLIPVGERVVERYENGLKLRADSARRNEFSDGRGESAFAVIETYYANGQKKQRYHALFVADASRWVLVVESYYATGQLEYKVQYGNGIIEEEKYLHPTGEQKKKDIDINILGDPQAIAVILSAQALLSDVWPANSEVPVPMPDAPKGSDRGSNDSAIAARQQAPKQEPDSPEAWFDLGVAYGDQGKYDNAVAAFRQVIKLKPADPHVWYNLGMCYAKQNKYDDAIAAYRQALKLKPDDSMTWCNLSVAYGHQSKYDDAVAASRQATKLKSDSPEAWTGLALAYAAQGKYDDAITACQQAIKLKPDDPAAWYGLGLSYAEQTKRSEALDALDHLRKLDPTRAAKLADILSSK